MNTHTHTHTHTRARARAQREIIYIRDFLILMTNFLNFYFSNVINSRYNLSLFYTESSLNALYEFKNFFIFLSC